MGVSEEDVRRIVREEIRASRLRYGPFHAFSEAVGNGSPLTREPVDLLGDPAERTPQSNRLSADQVIEQLRFLAPHRPDPLTDLLRLLTDAQRQLAEFLAQRHDDSPPVETPVALARDAEVDDTVGAPSDADVSSPTAASEEQGTP